ncbi:hypothetical protein ACFL3Z_02260 [Gemmatimonadota bacterium]
MGLGDEALLHLMREGFDTPSVAAYDTLRSQQTFTATAGLNVHPKLAMGPLLLPPYGPFFRTLVTHVALPEPLPQDDPILARAELALGLESGTVFVSLGSTRAAREFRLAMVEPEQGVAVSMGGDGPPFGRMILRGGFAQDPGRKVAYRILRNGREMAWILGPELEWAPPRLGIYRVEVYTYSARVGSTFFRLRPWLFSNAIGLRGMGDGIEY